MAAGIGQAIRDLEQRLTAQFQRQLLEQQEQQQQQVAALSQIVTQQRQAGTELQTEVPAQPRAGPALVQDDRIRALFVYNCNPLATLPEQDAVRRGLAAHRRARDAVGGARLRRVGERALPFLAGPQAVCEEHDE